MTIECCIINNQTIISKNLGYNWTNPRSPPAMTGFAFDLTVKKISATGVAKVLIPGKTKNPPRLQKFWHMEIKKYARPIFGFRPQS